MKIVNFTGSELVFKTESGFLTVPSAGRVEISKPFPTSGRIEGVKTKNRNRTFVLPYVPSNDDIVVVEIPFESEVAKQYPHLTFAIAPTVRIQPDHKVYYETLEII